MEDSTDAVIDHRSLRCTEVYDAVYVPIVVKFSLPVY